MQEIRFVMRIIGQTAGAISPEDFSEYLEYNFLSKGFKVWRQYETPVYGSDSKDVVGVKYWLTLIKESDEKPAKAVKEVKEGK